MVRILPTRLKPYSASNSASNSRSNSPMRSKGDGGTGLATPKDNGLALKIVVIKVPRYRATASWVSIAGDAGAVYRLDDHPAS